MSLSSRLQGVSVGRYKVRHGRYFFDKRVFWGVLSILVILGFVAAWQMGFKEYVVVYSCDEPVPCRNPFRDELGFCTVDNRILCEPPLLQPGEIIGEAPPWLARNYPKIGFLVIIAGFLLNHFLFNRDWRPVHCPLCGGWNP